MKVQRWTARPPAGETTNAEDRSGVLLRHAVVREPLDAGTLAAIQRRLPDGRPAPRRRLVLRMAVAIALFLSGGGVVMSATLLGHWAPFRRAPAESPPAASPAPSRSRVTVTPPIAPPVAVELDPTPPPAPPEPARHARPVRPRSVEPAAPDEAPPPAAAPAARPSPIAEEAALVAGALRALRERGDGAGALALLDERDARFGAQGKLGDETRTTRVEALLRLGQQGRALALLDGAALRPSGRGRALLATRGELRAGAGRCREAVADFDAVLADEAAADDATERALYQRGACHSRLGDSDSARVDLQDYVARFPAGRYAERARAALGR
jgi:TolA-binding protein